MNWLSRLFGKGNTPVSKEKELLDRIEREEKESRSNGMVVAPAPYEWLAIYYRKSKDYSREVAILDRYFKQKHSPGSRKTKILVARLKRAKELQSGKK